MGFRYRFRPPGRKIHEKISDTIKYNQKESRIAVISIILILGIFFVGSSVSGFVTYSESLEIQLSDVEQDLAQMTSERDALDRQLQTRSEELQSCRTTLSESETGIVQCHDEKEELQNYVDELNSQFTSCQDERNTFMTLYDETTKAYKNLVISSVKICCSAYDIQNQVAQRWAIKNDSIVCYSGPYTVNCSTGETDY